MVHRHMAVDIGSESGRVYIGHLKNGRIVTEEIHRFKTQFMQVHRKSLRNIYRYHEEIIKALQLYAQKYGDTLESIGVDSWGSDFVLLDRSGNISRLPASYRTTSKTMDVVRILEQNIGVQEIYMRTGNQAMPTDTLSQLIRLIREGDSSMDNPQGILFMGDVYHYMLGAQPCCEHSLASYCRFYNNHTDAWDQTIMRAFHIPDSVMLPVVRAGDVIGHVDSEILKEAGIHNEVKIITPCTHDTACAALAVPDLGEDWMFISSGTWSLMGTETKAPIINELSYRYNLSNSSMPLGTNMLKKNIQGMWVIQQCLRAWNNDYSYSELVELACSVSENQVYIDVDMEEFYSPENMAKAVATAVKRDFGVDVDWEDYGKISRICYESLALKYRYYCDKILEVADKTISKIYILGGGSKNGLLNQLTANATGYPVYTGVTEGSSIANILLQAYGSNEIKDKKEIRQVVCNTYSTKMYYPKNTEVWEEKYNIFVHHISHNAQW